MRERRTTVRVGCLLPAEYRRLDQSPAAGSRITNLSVEGFCLVASSSQPLAEGQRLRVNFILPHDEEPVSADGLVRWSGRAASRDEGPPIGVECEQLDETTRFRLQAFIADQTMRRAGVGRLGRRRSPRISPHLANRILTIGWPLLLGILGAALGVRILQLQQQREELRQTIAQRSAVITQLEVQGQQLKQAADQAQAESALSASELTRLQAERAQFEQEISSLSQGLDELKTAYVRLRDERDTLKNWVLALEQQQKVFQQRLLSIPELRRALRQAYQVEARRRREDRQDRLARVREADQQALQQGNQGYLVRDGRSTGPSPRLSIRVHTPETSPDSSP